MKRENDSLPTGRIARSTITGITAAKVGIKHLSYLGQKKILGKNNGEKDQEIHEQEIGAILYTALSQLRGTALKVSQMLSLEYGLFPEPIRRELAKACHQVMPLNRALIHKAFMNEFQTGYDKLFRKFNSEAFAAASLGQVHEAISFTNQLLAVKIQYPGIASSIQSDIKMIRNLLPAFAASTAMLAKQNLLQTVIDEIEERLIEEVNYLHEAEQTEWFANNLSLRNIRIPKVIHEFTRERVITFEKLPGKHIKPWLQTNPSKAIKNHFGQILFDFFIHTTFKLNKIHADPHPGNFIFNDDKSLGIIDFGCVKRLSLPHLEDIQILLNAFIKDQKTDNTEQILAIYKSMNMLASEVNLEIYQAKIAPVIKPLQFWLIEPYLHEIFDFSKKTPFPILSPQESMSITRYFTDFHRDQVYFNRFYTGIMFLLEEIGAVVKTTNTFIFSDTHSGF